MKKKNIIIVFIITLIVIGIIIGGFFLAKDKLKPTKKETETKNELKQAGSCTKNVIINSGYSSNTIKFDVKDAVPSTTESGKYDYYGQMSLLLDGSYRPIDYTWKLYTRTSSTLTPSESYIGNITVKRNSSYTNYDYLIIKYYPRSEDKGILKPTTVIFKYNSSENLYKLEKAIPFPQWQVLNYNGTNYNSDSGVILSMTNSSITGSSSDRIYYYKLPDDEQYDGLIEYRYIYFHSSGMSDILSTRQKGNLVISN